MSAFMKESFPSDCVPLQVQVLPNLLFGETAKITRELLKENNITYGSP